MTIIVRWATPNDQRLPVVSEHVPDSVVAARIAERRVAVADRDGRPVGALQLEFLWGTLPYIALIRVEESAQRQGVGRALLDFIAAALRDAGHERLYSSSQVNEPEPQAWHRHMGFTECGIIAGINAGGVGELFFV
jgi:N-acetylglutamate synthase-like GNAT family acetyltransferase